ncbi:cysteine hydrolase [Vagococcus sp. BWB3-3]|uniref:Cysteine hydrolase n=1 Tax=Vagococcus allomyrinae TaxID=2794353 RepID=A0A940P6R8_9ENTE|nr:isochorismatase family cysteine hydrolase [Vagococcus allomyrinae]MBP1042095.1 cysteine hydrolase [Vagococcus allomyrinae]
MLIFITIMFVSLIFLIGWRLHRLIAATTGPQISPQATGSALLVIDMQVGIINQPHYKKKEELIKAVQGIIDGANEQLDVIYIKHSIPPHPIDSLLTAGQMKPGTADTELIAEFANQSLVFHKHRADAFTAADFDAYLVKRQIKQLYLVGADASSCVYRTALGGKNRGYDVTILEDGLFATSQKMKEKMLVSYHKQGIQTATTPFQ